jgi:hypothetical protein
MVIFFYVVTIMRCTVTPGYAKGMVPGVPAIYQIAF